MEVVADDELPYLKKIAEIEYYRLRGCNEIGDAAKGMENSNKVN